MNPLERAARALCSVDGNPEDAEMNGKALWEDYLPEVRSILLAIREPSAEQLKAAGECRSSFIADVYTAMIDAVLEEDRGRSH